jgi:Winged helix-turn helix
MARPVTGDQSANKTLPRPLGRGRVLFEKAQGGGILVISEIKSALDQRLGRPVSLSSAYNLLHRHGWRKLVPDKRHVQSDPAAQAAWEKNSPKRSPQSSKTGQVANPLS